MAKCPKCNANVDPSDKRCSKCGELLDKKSTSPKLIIGIIAVIVVLAIVGAFATGMFNGHASGSTASHDSSVNDNSPKETVKPVSDNNSSASANTEYWASAKAENSILLIVNGLKKLVNPIKLFIILVVMLLQMVRYLVLLVILN